MNLVTIHQSVGDVLPADSDIGPFVSALAFYFQDLLVAFQAADKIEDEDSWKYAYFSRLQWAHLYESLLAVKRAEANPELRKFLAHLPHKAKAHLKEAKKVYDRHQSVLSRLRNQTVHYPAPTGGDGQREGWQEVKKLLGERAGDAMQMPEGKARDVQYPWAQDLAVRRIFEATGDQEGFMALTKDMAGAVQDFNRFVMAALDLALREGHVRWQARQ